MLHTGAPHSDYPLVNLAIENHPLGKPWEISCKWWIFFTARSVYQRSTAAMLRNDPIGPSAFRDLNLVNSGDICSLLQDDERYFITILVTSSSNMEIQSILQSLSDAWCYVICVRSFCSVRSCFDFLASTLTLNCTTLKCKHIPQKNLPHRNDTANG